MIALYCADIRDCLAHRQALESRLPPARATRMRAYRQDADRLRCLAAWWLLARSVGERQLQENPCLEGAHGKPWLAGGPCFNLSHAGQWVLLAVGDVEVGADIEVWSEKDCAALAEVAFHPAERAWWATRQSARDFFDLWVAKESYLKWLGTGLSRPPADFCLRLEGRTGQVDECPPARLRLYDALPGYSIAVCAAAPLPEAVVPVSLAFG
ncbi:MAG: 4'-phosphopantetheinyl transferase superfamily protein [Zoogloeaceae bacterium]|jgi:4'-phosphopantetheinyl transferase|nr:4'-phosphopantetheinyl transferase superfamily protein [Zoogloeaceae bacterium]